MKKNCRSKSEDRKEETQKMPYNYPSERQKTPSFFAGKICRQTAVNDGKMLAKDGKMPSKCRQTAVSDGEMQAKMAKCHHCEGVLGGFSP